jgi:alanine racemase
MRSFNVAAIARSDAEDADEVSVIRRTVVPRAAAATRVEVDLDAVVANLHDVKARVGPQTGVLAVLKADAYGHGTVAVARALESDAKVAGFLVTTVDDALLLRSEAICSPVLVMVPSYAGRHADVLDANVQPVLGGANELEPFARAARNRRGRASVHVKIDTGMARMGVREDALEGFLVAARNHPEIVISGLCTHLASADAQSPITTLRQLDAFDRACAQVRAAGHAPTVFHASNTAATFRHPRSHFTHVRTGIALFGGDGPSGVALRPAMRFVTRVAQLRWIHAGETVSYGERWRAERATRIATIPVGYGHGYPRRLSGTGRVLVRGRSCPVVGTICMEMMLVDVTDLGADVHVDDDVVLIGTQGSEEISAIDVARQVDGIVEEIFCGIPKSVPRAHVRRAAVRINIRGMEVV